MRCPEVMTVKLIILTAHRCPVARGEWGTGKNSSMMLHSRQEVESLAIDAQKQQEIIAAFRGKGASQAPCPICKYPLKVMDKYAVTQIQSDVANGIPIPGQYLVSALLACDRCGYLSQHQLSTLGINP